MITFLAVTANVDRAVSILISTRRIETKTEGACNGMIPNRLKSAV